MAEAHDLGVMYLKGEGVPKTAKRPPGGSGKLWSRAWSLLNAPQPVVPVFGRPPGMLRSRAVYRKAAEQARRGSE